MHLPHIVIIALTAIFMTSCNRQSEQTVSTDPAYTVTTADLSEEKAIIYIVGGHEGEYAISYAPNHHFMIDFVPADTKQAMKVMLYISLQRDSADVMFNQERHFRVPENHAQMIVATMLGVMAQFDIEQFPPGSHSLLQVELYLLENDLQVIGESGQDSILGRLPYELEWFPSETYRGSKT